MLTPTDIVEEKEMLMPSMVSKDETLPSRLLAFVSLFGKTLSPVGADIPCPAELSTILQCHLVFCGHISPAISKAGISQLHRFN